MMGKRFAQDTEDTHRIWIFPFANLVLRYERMLSTQKLILEPLLPRAFASARSYFACSATPPFAPHAIRKRDTASVGAVGRDMV